MTVRLKCLAPRPMASLRLLCIPFAGGGTVTFRRWAALLPPHIEAFAVQLPGREDRLREPALDDWQSMMDALIEAVAPLPFLPTAIFGHSLGAVIALELGRRMHARQPGRLRQVFASGGLGRDAARANTAVWVLCRTRNCCKHSTSGTAAF